MINVKNRFTFKVALITCERKSIFKTSQKHQFSAAWPKHCVNAKVLRRFHVPTIEA